MAKATTTFQMTGGAVEVEAVPQALQNRLKAQYRAKFPPPEPPLVHINADDDEAQPIYESNINDIQFIRAMRDYETKWINDYAASLFRRCVSLTISDEQRDLEIQAYIDQYNREFDLALTFDEMVDGDPHCFYIEYILSANEIETGMLYEYMANNHEYVTRSEIDQRRLLFRDNL